MAGNHDCENRSNLRRERYRLNFLVVVMSILSLILATRSKQA